MSSFSIIFLFSCELEFVVLRVEEAEKEQLENDGVVRIMMRIIRFGVWGATDQSQRAVDTL